MASATDKFLYVGQPGTATTLSAPGYTIGDVSITVGTTAQFPTTSGVIFAIDTAEVVAGEEVQIPGTYCVFSGLVTNGTTIANLTLEYGTPQNYASGALTRVYIPISSVHNERLIDGLLISHDQDGTMVDSLPLTTPRITTSINDANGNEVIVTPATASAVNEVTVTNAATTVAPSISASGSDAAVDLNLRGKGIAKTVTIGAGQTKIYPFDYVDSGLVWSGDAYGSTRNASMTSGVVVINGNPVTVASVTARTFTASRDTYIDVLDAGNGTGTLVYTEVTNNAASPALAANSIRIGIIITGASTIANVGSVNQGQEDKLLPITSSTPYAVTDSLGNLVCPRDSSRRIIGYRQITTGFSTTSTTAVLVTGLTMPIIVPTNRKIKLSLVARSIGNNTTNTYTLMGIYDTSVAGTLMSEVSAIGSVANWESNGNISTVRTPTATSKTYVASLRTNTGATTASLSAGVGAPTYIMAELV